LGGGEPEETTPASLGRGKKDCWWFATKQNPQRLGELVEVGRHLAFGEEPSAWATRYMNPNDAAERQFALSRPLRMKEVVGLQPDRPRALPLGGEGARMGAGATEEEEEEDEAGAGGPTLPGGAQHEK